MKHLLLILLISCSTYKPKSAKSPIPNHMEENYIAMVQSIQDEHGFIDTNHCDSLTHSGLIAVHPSIDVDLRAAEISPGEWIRRPTNYADCYRTGKSRSIISRDGLLSVILSAVVNKDLKLLEDMWEYGTKNNWIMGKTTHSVMNSNMVSLLARAIKKLGGPDHYLANKIPVIHSECNGYECHLVAVQIATYGEVEGHIESRHLDYLEELVKKNPRNILYQALYHKYLDGDFSKVHKLINEIYPSHRLPTNKDWCDDWRTQRDDNDPGLKPCKTEKKHSAGELIFVYWVIK